MRPRAILLAALVLAAPLLAQLTIVTDTVPDPVLGQPYPAVNIDTSGANGPVTWSIVNSPELPPGFVVGRSSQNSAGGIFCYGIPISGFSAPVCTGAVQGAAGPHSFTLRAQDAVSSVEQTFTFTLQNPFRITTEKLPGVAVDAAFSQQLEAAGGTGSLTWAVSDGDLPPGITLDGMTGLLSGTAPAEGASYFFEIQVTDEAMEVATRKFVINVLGTLQITTTSPAPILTILNQAMTPVTFQAAGGDNLVWSVPDGWTLPDGLTLSSGGVLSGTPTIAGTYDFLIQVISSTQVLPVARYFTLHVTLGSLGIVQPDLPIAPLGSPYQFALTPAGGLPPYSWEFDGGIPTQGLQIDPATGVITGTPQAAGSFPLPVAITDSIGTRVTKAFTLVVIGPPVLTTTSLPNATKGAAYNPPVFTATGGLPPYNWSVVGLLPPGLTIVDSVAGRIGGIPSVDGVFQFELNVTDFLLQKSTQQLSITVLAGLSIGATSLPDGATGTPYSQTLTATGAQGPLNWVVTSGAFPDGLALNAATGEISGTPTTVGSFNFVVHVEDGISTPVERTFLINVRAPLTITTTSLPAGSQGVSYLQALSAAGGAAPYTWSITSGALPPDLTLNSAASRIEGIPTADGVFAFSLTVTDSGQRTFTRQLSITVASGINITTSSLPDGITGTTYSQTLSASNAQGPVSWSVVSGTLPPDLTLSADGLISGTPTTPGSFNFTIRAADSGTPAERAFSINVIAPLAISTASLPGGKPGLAYSQTLSATGGQPPYAWSITSGTLPPDLTLVGDKIEGTPTTDGVFPFGVTVTDAGQRTFTRQLSITVASGINITTFSFPDGITGTAYSQALSASNAQGPVSWSVVSGTLPPDLTLSADGLISGTPTTAGSFDFTIRAADSGTPAERAFSINVIAPLAISTASLPGGKPGLAYSQTLSATGGQPPYAWSITSGTLPAQLALVGDKIEGTPTTEGVFAFSLTVTDSGQRTFTRQLLITVASGIVITTSSLPDGITGTAYSQTLASSAQGAVSWSVIQGALPAGLTLNGPTGAISGTPDTAGTANFTIQADDGISTPAERAFSINIRAPLTISTASLPNGARGVAYSQNLTASGGLAPYTWSLFTGTLPAGLTLSAAGEIGGTPTEAGTAQFQVSVADSGPQTALASFSIVVEESLAITTGDLSGSLGTAFSRTLAATGGVQPYTWAITSGALPDGLQLNATTGAITGTPTAAGSFNATFRVTDQTQVTASKSLAITISTAALPAVSFTSLPDSSPAARQPSVSVNLAAPYPAALTGTLTLAFASSVGGDDQTVQFSTGSRTLNFTIAAGATQATFAGGTPAVLTGTVAGTITITSQFSTGGQNVTPTPAPVKTIAVELAVPVISSVTLQRSGSTLTAVVTGYATSREMTTATYRFSAGSGNTLTQSDFPVQVASAFTTWFGSAASNATGGLFRLTLPFTIQGDATAVNLVSVTLTNTRGSSAAVGP